MRWFLDAIGLLTAVGLLLGVLAYQRAKERKEAVVERATCEVRRLGLEIKYRAASRIGVLNGRGWPVTVDPGWFGTDPPRNDLLAGARPWLEVATIDEAGLEHPPVRMAIREDMAAFWYNPYQGLVRARVPVLVSDADSLALYNRLNGCGLVSIFQQTGGLEGVAISRARVEESEGAPGSAASGREIEVTATGQVIKKKK